MYLKQNRGGHHQEPKPSSHRYRSHIFDSISQLVGAGGGFVHAVTFLQQLEQLLHGNAGIRGTTQGEDLPQQNTERPPETQTRRFPRCRPPQTSEPSRIKTGGTLTRRSGACRCDRRAPQEPSTSLANAPGGSKQFRFKVTAGYGETCSISPFKTNVYVCGLLVIVDVVDVPRQAKVRDLHHVVLRHQNVASSQISVDALDQWEQALLTRSTGRSHDPGSCERSPSWRPNTPSLEPPGRRRTPGP